MSTHTRHRELFLASLVACLRAFSFVVPVTTVRLLPSPISSWTAARQGRRLDHDTRGPVPGSFKRLAAPEFQSNEAVSYYHNPDSASKIWLVGVVHDAAKSSQLVETVIRKVKPQAVMVEVDPFRVKLLPPGESVEDSNGLWWWSPTQDPDQLTRCEDGGQAEYDKQDASQNPGRKSHAVVHRSRRKEGPSKKERSKDDRGAESTCEFHTAARVAVACGARVLLGDRGFEETKQRLAMAERADAEGARNPKGEDTEKVAAARITRRGFEGAPPAVWRKMRDLQKSWGARKFAVLVTERDEVMATNLLKLERNQSAVAVIGAHHSVGIGNILAANGWKTRRK